MWHRIENMDEYLGMMDSGLTKGGEIIAASADGAELGRIMAPAAFVYSNSKDFYYNTKTGAVEHARNLAFPVMVFEENA